MAYQRIHAMEGNWRSIWIPRCLVLGRLNRAQSEGTREREKGKRFWQSPERRVHDEFSELNNSNSDDEANSINNLPKVTV